MKTNETTPWDEFDIHLASSLKAQYTEHSDEEIEDRLSTIMSTNVSSLDERRRRPARMLPAVLVGAAAASLIAFTLLRTEPTTRVDTYPNLGPASIPDGGPKPAPTVKPAPTSAPTSAPSASNTTLGEAVPGPSGSVPTPSIVPGNEADDAAIEASFQAPEQFGHGGQRDAEQHARENQKQGCCEIPGEKHHGCEQHDTDAADGNLVYEFVDPGTDGTRLEEAKNAGVRAVQVNIPQKDKFEQMIAYMSASVKMGERSDLLEVVQGGSMEHTLGMSVKKVSIDKKPTIGFVQGHGEPSIGEMGEVYQSLDVLYEIATIPLPDSLSLPDRFAALLIVDPVDSFPEHHLRVLDEMLARGRPILIAYSGLINE